MTREERLKHLRAQLDAAKAEAEAALDAACLSATDAALMRLHDARSRLTELDHLWCELTWVAPADA